ncbi:hypothetical protein [Metabacillus dongyingensis]|uniref:hypothetical protein n=1 Tax=Metabacillus dongyingensis TaxID=2874282 RepID=UPI001CBBFFBD|nr:hypothetical protein [Metabacillus dongyingensis]UAL53611.1 hypothetical protein K8L98_07460 [Metabacillus dongyingensis]
MLSVSEKLSIFKSYSLLIERKHKDNIRLSYKHPTATKRQKTVISEFSTKTGNGYVCGKYLSDVHSYLVDKRGWINIKNFNEENLRKIIEESMKSLEK